MQNHLEAFISERKCIISVITDGIISATYSSKCFDDTILQLNDDERSLPIVQNNHIYEDEYLSKAELLELAANGRVPIFN